jgi:hypothetical protein
MIVITITFLGEEFYRNSGAVYWSVTCSTVPDGVGKIRIGDAIWPIADLVVAILISAATMGAGSGLSPSMLAVVQTVSGTASSSALELIKNGKWYPADQVRGFLFVEKSK